MAAKTRNWKLENRKSKIENRKSKLETGKSKMEIRNRNRVRNPKSKI